MEWSLLAAPKPEIRWRTRLIRMTELLTAQPRYRRFRSACEVAKSGELPIERDLAIGFVADWLADHLVCHDGATRFIESTFELGADEVRLIMVDHCGMRAARGVAAEPKIVHAAAQRLVRSPWAEVRVSLAGNASLSDELLAQLVNDPDPQVRHRAGWNPKLERTLEMLDAGDLSPNEKAQPRNLV